MDPLKHDIRFVEDDWEAPTLGAWGLGWEVWLDGLEITQFTYFQQAGGIEVRPVAGELTYGIERIAMFLQGVDNVYDLNFNGREGDEKVTYGDIFLQAEQEFSRHNFEFADTDMLFEQFRMAEAACRKYLEAGWQEARSAEGGVISVTERQSYILRVRELARGCGAAWLATAGGGAAGTLVRPLTAL